MQIASILTKRLSNYELIYLRIVKPDTGTLLNSNAEYFMQYIQLTGMCNSTPTNFHQLKILWQIFVNNLWSDTKQNPNFLTTLFKSPQNMKKWRKFFRFNRLHNIYVFSNSVLLSLNLKIWIWQFKNGKISTASVALGHRAFLEESLVTCKCLLLTLKNCFLIKFP